MWSSASRDLPTSRFSDPRAGRRLSVIGAAGEFAALPLKCVIDLAAE